MFWGNEDFINFLGEEVKTDSCIMQISLIFKQVRDVMGLEAFCTGLDKKKKLTATAFFPLIVLQFIYSIKNNINNNI